MEAINVLDFDEFAALYCARQINTPENLRSMLQAVKVSYPDCIGFMLLECQQLDSSSLGKLTILVYGPSNTYKEIPTHPISPRGLSSDMAVVKAILPADKL